MMRCAESQRGAVATGVALLLLILVTLLVLSAMQIAVGDQRSMASDAQTQRLAALAELELARGLTHLRANANRIAATQAEGWMSSAAQRWSACSGTRIDPPCGDGVRNLFDSRWTAYADVAEARYSAGADSARLHFLALALTAGTAAPRADVLQVVGESASADGRSRALVRQDVLIHPLIAQWPEATVIAASARFGGSGRIVAAPLSIWTAGDAHLADTSQTCAVSSDAASACGATLSEPGLEQADMLDVDGNLGVNRDSSVAPGDIVERVFGVGALLWPSLRAQMPGLDRCASLGPDTHGAWWIEGDCVATPDVAIGSATAPLLLVVANGRLSLDGNAFSGLLVLLSHDAGSSGIALTHDASIAGALVANGPLEISSGAYLIRPDAAVASALQSGAEAPLLLTPVPGSWRDY
ncbi:hypothetical protein [Hydrocarboniphaga sp.]|uniref:hypothetical protein n=1 Tax=Hydrocarboniphaga sp. TaxID=2033016 RepID=UPI003D107938